MKCGRCDVAHGPTRAIETSATQVRREMRKSVYLTFVTNRECGSLIWWRICSGAVRTIIHRQLSKTEL
jgi:hypothetical protein